MLKELFNEHIVVVYGRGHFVTKVVHMFMVCVGHYGVFRVSTIARCYVKRKS